jgi:hypothetical protein
MSDPETPNKPAKPKQSYANLHRITSNDAVCLHTIRGCRSEMARVYRMSLNHKIPAQDATRYIYALIAIRDTLVMEMDREPRLINPPSQEQPPIVIHAVPPSCYLSGDAINEIRKRELHNSYVNGVDVDKADGKLN